MKCTQQDTAKHFRVTAQLVKDLLREDKMQPEKLLEVKDRENLVQQKQSVVHNAVGEMIIEGKMIENSRKIVDFVKDSANIEVSEKFVR